MFTGIIEAIGSIRAMTPKGGDVRVYVATGKLDLGDVKLGDSIAVNGICLTAVELPGDGFWADVSRETLARTAFIDLKAGSRVNLEKALTPTSRLGGHLVSGHVDGLGRVASITDDARAQRWRFEAPPALLRYIAKKGSICVDGVSLTVVEARKGSFTVSLIPETLARTTLGSRRVGELVNLEADVIAKHVAKLVRAYLPAGAGTPTEAAARAAATPPSSDSTATPDTSEDSQ